METRKHTHSLSFLHAIECSKLPCAMFPPSGNKAATRQQKGVGGHPRRPSRRKKLTVISGRVFAISLGSQMPGCSFVINHARFRLNGSTTPLITRVSF